MSNTYDISLGNGKIELTEFVTGTYVGMQLVADASLDADITVKLVQSSDGDNFEDLADTEKTLVSGGDSVFVETFDYILNRLYVDISVGSATAGELTALTSDKKKESSSDVDATITGTADVNVTNTPLGVTETNPVLTTPNFDAFGRLRVSQVNSQADLKMIYDELPLFYDIEDIGTGSNTYNAGNSDLTIQTAANSDGVVVQTKQRFNYSSGKSALMLCTFRFFDTETNITKRIGYFNSTTSSPFALSRDGIYLENRNGSIDFTISKNGTHSRVNQSSWDDPMDGTGASGIDLQLGTSQGNYIMWLDYEWLGVGNVRFGFIKNGAYYIAHEVDHILDGGVYMTSPNHSIRAEIFQNGAGSGTFKLICATYGSEGTINSLGKILSDNMGNTHVDANSTSNTYALMGIRLGSSYLDTLVDVLGFSILAITNDSQRWELWLNPTVAGTFTYSAVSNSSMETAKGSGSGNTVTTTGATLIDSGYISSNTSDRFQIESAIRLGATIAGVSDEMVLCTTPLSSNSDVIASITWREVS